MINHEELNSGMRHRLLIFFFGVTLFFAVYFPILDTDIWWHLAAGRLILEQWHFLNIDPFSLSAGGKPWIDLHWLFQVLFYLVYQLAGIGGIVAIKAILFSFSAVLLLLATESGGGTRWRPIYLLSIALPLYFARHLVLERPIVVTLVYAGLFIYLLERFRLDTKIRRLLWLLPIQVLWANTQGLFLIGPAVLGCYLIGEGLSCWLGHHQSSGFQSSLSRKHLGQMTLLGGALLVCGVCTPYGWSGLNLPFNLLGRISSVGTDIFSYNISENIPTWVLERSEESLVGYFKWTAAVGFGSFLLCPKHIGLSRFLLLTSMFCLALLANRNILLFCWIAGFVIAVHVGLALEGLAARFPRLTVTKPPVLVCLCFLVLLVLDLHRGVLAQEANPAQNLAPFRVPMEATEYLQKAHLPGNLFNSVRYGGYLAWKLYPTHRPFIDGRLVLRTKEQFAEYLHVLDHPPAFDQLQHAYHFQLALLPTAYPERYLKLVAYLYRHPQWRLIYTDGTQTLFVLDRVADESNSQTVDLGSPVTSQAIVKELSQRYAGDRLLREQAVFHLGRLLAEIGELERAAEVLRPLPHHDAQALLARVYYLTGQPQEARALSERLIRLSQDDINSLTLLALIDLDRGHYAEALAWIQRALAVDPYEVKAKQVLAHITEAVTRQRATPHQP